MKYTSRDDRFTVVFTSFPALVPRRMATLYECGFNRWRGAAAVRTFSLRDDWSVVLEVDPADFDGVDLSGTIVIPVSHEVDGVSVHTILDGASVPMPWLVSFLSFGLLRPVGVMLTASIVHDFAFQHGVLLYRQAGSADPEPVSIERHHADRLFERTISVVNHMPWVGRVGWLAVRLGWLWVPYAAHRWQKPIPWGPIGVLAMVLAVLAAAVLMVGPLWLITGSSLFYLLGYLVLWLAGPPSLQGSDPGSCSGGSDGD